MTFVTLGGFEVMTDSPVKWGYRIGTEPMISRIKVTRDVCDAILQATAGNTPTTLRIGNTTWEKIFVLRALPGHRRHEAYLEIADLRYWWRYQMLGPYYFNVSRRSGEQRWINGVIDGTSTTGSAAQDIGRRLWSQLFGQDWTAEDAIDRIFGDLAAGFYFPNNTTVVWQVDALPSSIKNRGVPIQDLIIHSRGNAALAQILGYLVGVSGYIDEGGNWIWVDLLNGAEISVIAAAPMEERDTGYAARVSHANLMPGGWRVHFSPQIEVRVGFSSSTLPGSTLSLGSSLLVENVLRCIDPELSVSRGGITRTITFGQYMTFDEFYAAMAAYTPTFGASGLKFPGDISESIICNGWAVGALEMQYASAQLTGVQPDPLWNRRISEVYNSFRQTFRLPRDLLERVRDWKVTRATLVDPESGARGVSTAYCDHAMRKPVNRVAKDFSINDAIADNVACSPQTNPVIGRFTILTPLTEANASAAILRMVDRDLGIFHTDFSVANKWGKYAETYPCALQDPLPKHSDGPSEIAVRNVIGAAGLALSATHEASFIISCTPATQGPKGLYHVDIEQKDIETKLGIKSNTQSAGGAPFRDLFISPNVEGAYARFMWLDGTASKTKEALGYGVAPGASPSLFGPLQDMKPQLCNGEQLDKLALAHACADYLEFIDGVEGDIRTAADWQPRPTGRLYEVEISVQGDRTKRTTAKFTSSTGRYSFMAFADMFTLQRLGILVDPMDF